MGPASPRDWCVHGGQSMLLPVGCFQLANAPRRSLRWWVDTWHFTRCLLVRVDASTLPWEQVLLMQTV